MSQENVEIVKAAFDAWNVGDMGEFRDSFDPNVVVRTVPDWPEPGPYVGREAVMRFFEQLRETWDADDLKVIGDFIDAGDEVAARYISRGAGQGPELHMEITAVWIVHSGRIVRMEHFWDR